MLWEDAVRLAEADQRTGRNNDDQAAAELDASVRPKTPRPAGGTRREARADLTVRSRPSVSGERSPHAEGPLDPPFGAFVRFGERTVVVCGCATDGNLWPKFAVSGTSATDPHLPKQRSWIIRWRNTLMGCPGGTHESARHMWLHTVPTPLLVR